MKIVRIIPAVAALFIVCYPAMGAPITTQWIAPGDGVSGKSIFFADGSSLDGKMLRDWGLAIDSNAATAANAIPKQWRGADTNGTVLGIAPLNEIGNSTAPAVTVIPISELDASATPADTDVTIYTLTPTGPATVALGTGAGAGHQKIVELLVTNMGTGGFAVTISGPISWPNGAVPTVSAAPGDKTLIRFLTLDGGQTYIGGI